jgi:hypothetical protein
MVSFLLLAGQLGSCKNNNFEMLNYFYEFWIGLILKQQTTFTIY